MGERFEVRVPDLGGAESVRVVEILVSPGDRVDVDGGLVTLESDKASMDVPSPRAGVVREVRLADGQEVAEGDVVVVLEVEEAGKPAENARRGDREAPPAEREPALRRSGPEGDGAEPEPGGAPRPPLPRAAPEDLHAEVLVLGAGPGGYTAAFRAADLGKSVVLVERDPVLGGVCLNVGCIPSKALLHVARVLEEARDLAEHGVELGAPRFDLAKLRTWKDGVVRRLNQGLAASAKQRQVRVIQGSGGFASPHELAVETAEGRWAVTFDSAVVAAGSRPIRLPAAPDDPRIMDSTGALELADVPPRLLLVGGGIIGLEMAMVYGSLGSELTVVELLDGLIPGCDRDLVRPLERRLRKRMGAHIHLATRVAAMEAGPDGITVALEGEGAPASAVFDRVLVAVGRRSNADSIGAGYAGLEMTQQGLLQVDKQLRTQVPHIFAIGDIVGGPMLAHKASHQGKVAAEVIAGHSSVFDARAIPSVAYTDPEIAWVGLTETDARREGTAYELGSFPWSASGRSLGTGRDDGSTKILFDPATRRILGAGLVGLGAGELVAELALAIEMGCEAEDIGLTVHPHPTLSETVGFAAEAFAGTITDLYLPERR